jgi:hypothetical protein
MDRLGIAELWEKDACTGSGRHLGRIEAVGMGRDRVPRQVGARFEDGGRQLTFYALTGARVEGGRVVLAVEPSLEVLPVGAS